MNRRRVLRILAASALTPSLPVLAEDRVVLGAEAALRLHGPADVTGPARTAAWAEIDRLAGLFDLHDPSSALNRLNRTGRLSDPPPEMLALLDLCDRLHRWTEGRFDPTVQPLWRALARGQDPAGARALIGWDRVRVAPGLIALDKGQELTLNGIAQGYITDRIAEVVRDHGLGHALVEVGEYRALGGPFQLGLSDPEHGRLGQTTLIGNAVATSSPGALALGPGSHIIDTKGLGIAWSTVSVTAPSAALADGLSTALCLATETEARAIVARVTPRPGKVQVISRAGSLHTL